MYEGCPSVRPKLIPDLTLRKVGYAEWNMLWVCSTTPYDDQYGISPTEAVLAWLAERDKVSQDDTKTAKVPENRL